MNAQHNAHCVYIVEAGFSGMDLNFTTSRSIPEKDSITRFGPVVSQLAAKYQSQVLILCVICNK